MAGRDPPFHVEHHIQLATPLPETGPMVAESHAISVALNTTCRLFHVKHHIMGFSVA